MKKEIVIHRIIALWCHPRSMSTAIERLMRARGDLLCMHEPFMYDYYLSQDNREMPYFQPSPDQAQTYEQVRQMILLKAESTSVFIKDMSYYVLSNLESDRYFSKQLTHSFLIRNPQASISSYYALDKEVTLEEIGYEAQWRHYTHLITLGIDPVVIQAESIGRNPRSSIGDWWQSINLDYVDNAFEWSDEHPSDWNAVKTWHSNVIASSAIKPRTSNDADTEQYRFDDMLKIAPHLQTYLDHHMPYYELLRSKVGHDSQ